MSKVVLKMENVTGKKRGFNLQDVNLELMPGFIYGLIGENGAGKSTLMNYIMNEDAKYDGTILIDGEDISGRHSQVMNKVGFVSEDNLFLEDRTCMQNVQILSMLYDDFDEKIFVDAMKEMEVSVGNTYKKMSRGEKLKFQTAFAMAHKPSLYLLDEVTVGMDPVFRQDYFKILQKLIADEETAVLMTSHIASEIERKTDYAGIMKEGKLIAFGESLDILSCETE